MWLNKAEKFAYGRLGWRPHEFDAATPYEFELACQGYNERREDEFWDNMEVARFAVTPLINLWLDKAKRKSPMDMFPFPRDPKGKKVYELEPKDRKRVEKRLKANPPVLNGKRSK